ncbi:MAG TPA: TonB-dependent receptor [Chitinophagaceae bacterium]|nr:TonB-dependent receptor [Chitinophagaceae bacterium]
MAKRLIFLALFFFSVVLVFAQPGTIDGKVTDVKSGGPVIGASITISGDKTVVATDVEGRFVLNLASGKKYVIKVSSVGYKTKELANVEVVANKVIYLDITMETASRTETEVVVKSTPKKETINALLSYQRSSPVVAQVMSAEIIRRSPDKNTGEVLKRVPGTSVQEGKYLVVRGLADRYNQAMLNGVLLSSTEPDRKTFSFDIFPVAVIDNIIINKAFVPELPGEWAGGLVQVNTKDIPAKGFINIQLGTGFNTQTIGNDFYTYKGGKADWLGIDDGFRALPADLPTKSKFAAIKSQEEQAAYGRKFQNVWTTDNVNAPLNATFQISGGFNTKIFGRKTGGILALTYNKSNKRVSYSNLFIPGAGSKEDFFYQNEKYNQDVLAGLLANFTIQLNAGNKISFKNILNINSTDYVLNRTGLDYILGGGVGVPIRATELGFKQNTFFNTQALGEHNLAIGGLKLKWFGSFNILDQYIPDQRRLQYYQDDTQPGAPYLALLAGGNSQKSGSRFYSFLSDYIYNAGGDLSKTFLLFDNKQTIKAGYLFQVKDRLFDSRPFYYQIERDNSGTLVKQSPDKIFAPENITGKDGGIVFGELEGIQYRYIANTILNAAFLQLDNQFTDKLRIVWGVRYESFDQVVGSLKTSDPRHVASKVIDFLPGVNVTYKLNGKTNLRLSGSQTVVRPEFRELSNFAFYDFELGATVIGNKTLQRTKITNADLRYEWYPRSGELITLGVFYKNFKRPIELYFNVSGAGSSNTFNFQNADKANSYGIELEFRKKLDYNKAFKNFTISGNVSYIYNRVTGLNLNRPMQGQSPYLINLGVQYDVEKIGFTSTLLFNRIGRRILFVGNINNATGVGVPEIWENPRSILDLQLSKKLFKQKGEIKLNLSDLLNEAAYFYHDLNGNKKLDKSSSEPILTKDVTAIRRIYGTNISFSFSYNIK